MKTDLQGVYMRKPEKEFHPIKDKSVYIIFHGKHISMNIKDILPLSITQQYKLNNVPITWLSNEQLINMKSNGFCDLDKHQGFRILVRNFATSA